MSTNKLSLLLNRRANRPEQPIIQEEPGELEKGNRVAPFLIHDAAALTDVFVQMSSAAMCVRDIAFLLYRSQFREGPPREADPALREIAEKSLIRLRSRMPFEGVGS